MSKIIKLIILFLIISSFYYINAQETEIVEEQLPDELLNPFLRKNNSVLLTEMFTVNIGIMRFKNIGDLKAINPMDSENVVNSIKNELENVRAVQLSRKAAVLKAMNVYLSRGDNTGDEVKKDNMAFLKRRIFYSEENLEGTSVYEVFLKLRSNPDFEKIAKQWFENIENPFYVTNILKPFDRILQSNEDICLMKTTKKNVPLDFLINGEIEKIDNIYFVTVYVYSALLNKNVAEYSYIADKETLSEKTSSSIRDVIPKIFLIDYASLSINTNDEEIRIYLDSEYVGRNNVFVDYVIPGKYVVTLKKEEYKNVIENIDVLRFEEKKLTLKMEEKEELQIVNFFIEPFGTKIFINSVFQAKTPFKKALPKGSYVLSAKNDLYEDHRYVFEINEVSEEEEEKNIAFHLKSKDIQTYFQLKKNLYYTAFWNFTFSLIVTVPLIVFAKQTWDMYDYGYSYSEDYPETDVGKNTKLARDILYGFSAAMITHTTISLGLLFTAIANYLITLEKRDFIPIIDYYHNIEGEDGITLGMKLKLK